MGTPYRECPNCGAHLDAGEPCDCTHKRRDQRPAAEPEKPLKRVSLMVVCREVDKETGKIAVYPLKTEIDDRVMQCLQIQARANPELRYFALVFRTLGALRGSDSRNLEAPERHAGRRG